MNIVIPMAGAGKRFSDAGYTLHKPVIPVTDHRTGKEFPMVVCAAADLPGLRPDGSNLILIDRDFHQKDGVETQISKRFPGARFITVDELTEGQACTCLLAKQQIDNEEELLIAGCDNGMLYQAQRFEAEKAQSDCLVFTYRHNRSVLKNPDAYGWVVADHHGAITELSIKRAVSDMPMEDHAIVATFWFRTGHLFVAAAEKMIQENDRINGEFYVDEAIRHLMDMGYRARVFEIDRYFGWGTPEDYEEYMKTISYWTRFCKDPRCLFRHE